ncbi:MAG TPA: sensor domain-containing diguanylate cyclase [Methylomirabilota bacterium]|nr:sensor domain-containing diguanylate cyclase [Methylomirabilota bacterium]
MPSQSKLENATQIASRPSSIEEARRPAVRIIFAHGDQSLVERSVQELKRVGFAVESHVVTDANQLVNHPQRQSFDIAVCQYSSDSAHDHVCTLATELPKDLPLILLVDNIISKEDSANLMLRGAFDCVHTDAIGHLPVAVRRALNERSLRHERDRAERELRRLRAQYRALAGNLSYGICRCDLEGAFLDVNQALLTMLRYPSKEELLEVNLAGNIFADPVKRAQLLGKSQDGAVDPVEAEWTRQDGSTIKVRLSAQEVLSEQGQMYAYEVIVEDVTKQRELEDHLRRLAASDPLTGLANYRHLIDALDMEIRRSNRTGREFSLLLFDMDGLKQLNDSFGHMAGSQALCRTADALTLFCRDIDTAARFGGDEFALLLPETGREAAHSVARRISSSIAEDSNGPRISVSVGVGVYPLDGDNVESLVSAADTAMYAMKRRKAAEALR